MITTNTTCPMAECPKKDECARHAFYLQALAESDDFTVLNTIRLHPTEDGCPHFIVPRVVRMAYGFKRLAATIPRGNARNMDWIVGQTSDSTFYRYQRGERPIAPYEQQLILREVEAAGGDPSVGFNRYEDVTVYIKP